MKRGVGVIGPLLLALVLGLPACGTLPGTSDGGYHLTAYFSRAVALYPHSRVKVMGVDAGTVDSIEIDGDRIKVGLTVRDDVPLPSDVRATIAAITLIGERNVVLGPPWRQGQPRARDGDVIPLDRTSIPVEPDEALQALTDLAKAIDPDAVGRLVTSAANALDGQGQNFNDLLRDAAGITGILAAQDDQLVEVATNLHKLAGTLNAREQQLGSVIDAFSKATGVLAAERSSLSDLLGSLVRLSNAGTAILDAYGGQLPGDIAILTKLGLVFQADVQAIEQLIAAFPALAELIGNSWDPDRHLLKLRVSLGPTASDQLNKLFANLLPVPLPCVPLLGQACP